jgi:hypothetical protein
LSNSQTHLARKSPLLATWEAQHDNGWRTALIEQPDRTFIVRVGPGSQNGVVLLEGTLAAALRAALWALERGSGHAACSEACSEWVMTVSSDVPASDEGGERGDLETSGRKPLHP